MTTEDELRDLLNTEIERRPSAMFAFARLANLLRAIADTQSRANSRKLERPKELDLEQLNTYESVIALIDGLFTDEQKKGIYDGIRSGRE